MWNISRGFLDAVGDILTGRQAQWVKTVRFNRTEGKNQDMTEPESGR